MSKPGPLQGPDVPDPVQSWVPDRCGDCRDLNNNWVNHYQFTVNDNKVN